MSSGIGNLGLMRALGDILGINDPKQAPARLKTDELIPVVGIDPGMAGQEQIQLTAAMNVGGIATATWQPFGGLLSETSAGLQAATYLANAKKEIVILGMQANLSYDAAGRDADYAVSESGIMQHYRQAAGSTISVISDSNFGAWAPVDYINTSYVWTYPMWQPARYLGSDPPSLSYPQTMMAASPLYVPAGSKYGVTFARRAGNWPANTVLTVFAFAVACPKGMRPPGI